MVTEMPAKARKAGRPWAIPKDIEPVVAELYHRGYGYRYSPVSTGDQAPANQSAVLTEWANHRGYEVVRIYEEQESAWKTGHQRELAKLLADAQGDDRKRAPVRLDFDGFLKKTLKAET